MKTLQLGTKARIIIYMVFFSTLSCTVDNAADLADSNSESGESQAFLFLKNSEIYPGNICNEYDQIGQIHNEITEEFLDFGENKGNTDLIITETESLANLNSNFLKIKAPSYESPVATRIDYILDNPQQSTSEIISTSSLSLQSQLALTEFLTKVMNYKAQKVPYEIIYHYIIQFEGNVNLASYNLNDRRIILSTTSITRHAFYFAAKKKKKRPRDRDWDISWGNITAGTEGSEEDFSKAIIMSVVAGLRFNQ